MIKEKDMNESKNYEEALTRLVDWLRGSEMETDDKINDLCADIDELKSQVNFILTKIIRMQLDKIPDDDDGDLTIGQAIDALNSGQAKKISCYAPDTNSYVHIDGHTGELRTRALNGQFFPWIITQRERDGKWRVVERPTVGELRDRDDSCHS